MRSQFQATCLFVSMSLAALCAPASAQDAQDPMTPAAAAPTSAEATPYVAPPPQTQLAEPMDGPRFRFGIAGALGGEFVEGLSGLMIGLDLRTGVQINHLVGVYLQQHLSFGKLSNDSGASGMTGTYVATLMGDVTLSDRLVVGAGIGYGVLNNPSGFALALRAAYYPLLSVSPVAPRRKGLMVGLDLRTVFTDVGTGVVITAGVGYEAF